MRTNEVKELKLRLRRSKKVQTGNKAQLHQRLFEKVSTGSQRECMQKFISCVPERQRSGHFRRAAKGETAGGQRESGCTRWCIGTRTTSLSNRPSRWRLGTDPDAQSSGGLIRTRPRRHHLLGGGLRGSPSGREGGNHP